MTIPFKDNRVFIYWNKHGKAIARHGGPRTKYNKGLLPPNYPVPAIRECPLCGSKHIGHSHFVSDGGLIVPMD